MTLKQNLFQVLSFKFMILILGLILMVSGKCYDRPECFKKVFLNFGFPEMNLFQINGTKEGMIEYQIKAYGDFNNDLYTDYVGINDKREIFVFEWNSETWIYQVVFTTTMINGYIPKRIYLVDINGDGRLDFVVWGVFQSIDEQKSVNPDEQTSCLAPFIQQIPQKKNDEQKVFTKFLSTIIKTMAYTSDPIVIGHKFKGQVSTVGFLVFQNGARTFLIYNDSDDFQKNSEPKFNQIKWNQMVESKRNFENTPFNHPHWNAFIDLTGDCLPDLAILSSNYEIQIWIAVGNTFKFNNYYHFDIEKGSVIQGFTFSQINYDGGIDMIFAYNKKIQIFLNKKSLEAESNFCCSSCKNLVLNDPISISMPQGKTIKSQSLHFGDINIDGYPDLLLILVDETTKVETIVLLENLFGRQSNSFSSFSTPNYNSKLLEIAADKQIISASFLDILQNGILDIVISYRHSGKIQTQMLYNNFLCQNDFFIKGYGLLGPNNQIGSQFPGMSFYWVNSIKNSFKVTYQAQLIQTSYDSLQIPYTFSGLGKANNYVQRFTVVRNGEDQQWSPTIPNSQLGVFTFNGDKDQWKIRIFAFPLYDLYIVIIVTVVILAFFGVFLMLYKCKGYQKKEEPLEVQFMS